MKEEELENKQHITSTLPGVRPQFEFRYGVKEMIRCPVVFMF